MQLVFIINNIIRALTEYASTKINQIHRTVLQFGPYNMYIYNIIYVCANNIKLKSTIPFSSWSTR